jgi:opacity protein-like surface antigen
MNTIFKHVIVGILALAVFALPTLSVAAEEEHDAESWKFVGEIYGWGADINAETATGDDIKISLSDILDNLDLTIMGKLAAMKGKWSLVGDLIYLDIEDDSKGTAKIINRSVSTKTNVELKALIGTIMGGYSVYETKSVKVDMAIGARYIRLEADVKFDLGTFQAKVSDSDHNWDGIVGINGRFGLAPKWFMTSYADVGTGESELTWQALAGVGYQFDKAEAVFGYRYMDYQFDDGALIDNLNIKGPFAGLRYTF